MTPEKPSILSLEDEEVGSAEYFRRRHCDPEDEWEGIVAEDYRVPQVKVAIKLIAFAAAIGIALAAGFVIGKAFQ